MVEYLISGGPDLAPSVQAIGNGTRVVVHDDNVNDNASKQLVSGGRYIVIAHGSADGTVHWFKSSRGSSQRWLWVTMPNRPEGARIYLYCCNVGPHLRKALTGCEVLGHVGPVPMPDGSPDDPVLEFLQQVERLASMPAFAPEESAIELLGFASSRFAEEVEFPSESMKAAVIFYQLVKSLSPETLP